MSVEPRRRKKLAGKGNIGHFLYAEYSAALPKRAAFISRQLGAFNAVFTTLFRDEDFRTLLRAEAMTALPIYLAPLIEGATGLAKDDCTGRRR